MPVPLLKTPTCAVAGGGRVEAVAARTGAVVGARDVVTAMTASSVILLALVHVHTASLVSV